MLFPLSFLWSPLLNLQVLGHGEAGKKGRLQLVQDLATKASSKLKASSCWGEFLHHQPGPELGTESTNYFTEVRWSIVIRRLDLII